MCASLDLLSGIDAFDKFFGAFDGVAPNVMLSRNGFSRIFWFWPILGYNLSARILIVTSSIFGCHFLRLILPTDQVCLLCVG